MCLPISSLATNCTSYQLITFYGGIHSFFFCHNGQLRHLQLVQPNDTKQFAISTTICARRYRECHWQPVCSCWVICRQERLMTYSISWAFGIGHTKEMSKLILICDLQYTYLVILRTFDLLSVTAHIPDNATKIKPQPPVHPSRLTRFYDIH